jgi:ribosomal protein L29
MSDAPVHVPEGEVPTPAGPQVEGKRTQLRIIREDVQTLSSDVGNFQRRHDAGAKKLEKQIATLRSELAAQSVSKSVGDLRKSHDAGAKRLEKQVVTLRKELADLKSHISKDAARSRAKQEAILSRILAKVSVKPKLVKSAKKPKSSKPVKSAKKR